MGGVMRFVFALIWFALALGVIGELLEATIFSRQHAEDIYRSKGVSATWWNQQINKTK